MTSVGTVELRAVTKRFDEVVAVDDLNLRVESGEFLTLLGPSGCGKTTTLRMVAGFEQPSTGQILIDGTEASGLPPFKRNVNTVFQNYALFPHMTVAENVGFGLRMRRIPRSEVRKRVGEALGLIQLDHLTERRPNQLSGGQQQRVALARALVNHPAVLLLDEPLGALDLKLRKEMQVELKRVQERVGITFIYVTHDQEEALTMSDRVAVMRSGRILQLASPAAIYDRPANRFVAEFIGESNFLSGAVVASEGGTVTVDVEDAGLLRAEGRAKAGDVVTLAVRPERIRVAEEHRPGLNAISSTVVATVFRGSDTRLLVRIGNGQEIAVELPNRSSTEWDTIRVGSEVHLTWEPASTSVLTG